MPTFTLQQHDNLANSISQGALTVKYGDKLVTYRSLDEMMRLLKLMKQDLGLIKSNSGRKLATFSKGIEPGCSDDIKWIR